MTVDEALGLVDFVRGQLPPPPEVEWRVDIFEPATDTWECWAISRSLEALLVLTQHNPRFYRAVNTRTGIIVPMGILGDA